MYNLLLWIIDEYQENNDVDLETKSPTGNSTVHQQVLSIALDIIHSTSKGRICTPKHILLPLTIHTMTGTKNAVTLLNRFGQLEVQTAMAECHLDRTNDGEVFFFFIQH